MSRRLLSREWGVSTWMEADSHANRFHVHQSQDVEPLIELNKRDQIAPGASSKGRKTDGLRLVARIPNTVLSAWMAEGFITTPYFTAPGEKQKVIRRLNTDPQWRYLKSVPWRI